MNILIDRLVDVKNTNYEILGQRMLDKEENDRKETKEFLRKAYENKNTSKVLPSVNMQIISPPIKGNFSTQKNLVKIEIDDYYNDNANISQSTTIIHNPLTSSIKSKKSLLSTTIAFTPEVKKPFNNSKDTKKSATTNTLYNFSATSKNTLKVNFTLNKDLFNLNATEKPIQSTKQKEKQARHSDGEFSDLENYTSENEEDKDNHKQIYNVNVHKAQAPILKKSLKYMRIHLLKKQLI